MCISKTLEKPRYDSYISVEKDSHGHVYMHNRVEWTFKNSGLYSWTEHCKIQTQSHCKEKAVFWSGFTLYHKSKCSDIPKKHQEAYILFYITYTLKINQPTFKNMHKYAW